ncbi:protein THALLO isoform X1 [Nicotiana tomentosiformis]|uniref:protein THALLO isoform X1 n=1 Tax=Nicotiana tomentosiformis TaxID=4098 RepID=UPI00051B82E8|nr:something about silencing protein 10 isoform X1 [Nicotiana tomentosiformis]
MGKKAGKFKKKENNNAPKKAKRDFYNEDDDMMNDAIDAFHEQRDMIPLNVNEDDAESDEDNEHPVYDLKEDEDEEDEDDDLDDAELTGLGAKIARTQKYLRATMGGVEDEMHDEAEEEKEERPLWGRGKNIYYYQDKQGPEQESSDEDLIAEEEAEVLRLQQKKAKSLSAEDFGLEDDEEELTLEEILAQGKSGLAVSADGEAKNETGTAYEEVQKDLNALTKEEQMDVVYSSAPELVGLLSELSEALEQLDNKVNPILNKINGENMIKGGMHYIEVKKLLLLSYCQAITFYLLLKSEGQPVRDHPVISRLVEIKNLLNKMKELDGNLPSELEDFLHKNVDNVTGVKLAGSNLDSEPLPISHKPSVALADVQETEPHEAELVEANGLKSQQKNESKRKRQDDQVGIQSREMLKVRADLEEKWKQTGVLSSIARKHEKQNKRLRLLNGQLATPDDFDDDAMVAGDDREIRSLNKLSRLVTPQVARPKVISGDDDLPKRDDIGERRRKHELRVLAGAGVEPSDDVEDEPGNHASDDDVASSDDGEMDSDLEFYKEVEKQHSAKLVAKEKMYSSRAPVISSTTETLVDGKRQINYQMEKNRGLTRHRNKLTKNPRKKYRGKHEKQQKRRKGQVRDIKKPSGPYGGETTGINAASRRSIRL